MRFVNTVPGPMEAVSAVTKDLRPPTAANLPSAQFLYSDVTIFHQQSLPKSFYPEKNTEKNVAMLQGPRPRATPHSATEELKQHAAAPVRAYVRHGPDTGRALETQLSALSTTVRAVYSALNCNYSSAGLQLQDRTCLPCQ